METDPAREPDTEMLDETPVERGTAAEPLRSGWAQASAMMREYYDREWGLPVTGERELYERLCLEGFQAGLSWATVLSRREAFRRAFAGFDPQAVAAFGPEKVEELVQDASIIRSRIKIESAIGNARATLALREAAAGTEEHPADPALAAFELPRAEGAPLPIEAGLPALIWSFAPKVTPRPADQHEVPTQTPDSAALARELKRRGFRFIGPVSAFALMEACGMVDTHWVDSHRRGVSGIFRPDGARP